MDDKETVLYLYVLAIRSPAFVIYASAKIEVAEQIIKIQDDVSDQFINPRRKITLTVLVFPDFGRTLT